MQNKKAQTLRGYLATLPESRRADIKTLDVLIRKTAPKLKPVVLNDGLGYGPYHYRYATGREGDSWVIALASRKQYISLYVSCVVEKGFLAERYKKDFPHANIGKCCIRFKKLEHLPEKALTRLLKEAQKLGGMCAAKIS